MHKNAFDPIFDSSEKKWDYLSFVFNLIEDDINSLR